MRRCTGNGWRRCWAGKLDSDYSKEHLDWAAGRSVACLRLVRPRGGGRSVVRRIQHALTGSVYEWAEDDIGPVLVTDKRGRQGRFDRNGRWVLGDLRVADPELCRWIESGGPKPGGAAARSRRFETEETFS